MKVSLRISLPLISRIATLFTQFSNWRWQMVNSRTLECTLQKKWSLEMATPEKKVETARTEKND